jgi:hypothetical protein
MYSWAVEETYDQCRTEAIFPNDDDSLANSTIAPWFFLLLHLIKMSTRL